MLTAELQSRIRADGGKSEGRNPKSEGNPKTERPKRLAAKERRERKEHNEVHFLFVNYVFFGGGRAVRPSDFELLPYFGPRISGFRRPAARFFYTVSKF
jgi:hypothetical protein